MSWEIGSGTAAASPWIMASIKRFYESFISADVMADFGGEMQTVDDVLMQRDCCAVAAGISPVATGIVEKWWRQHMNDLDGGAT